MGGGEFERLSEDALPARLVAASKRLAEEFDGIYDQAAVQAAVEESAKALSTKGVTPYVHILAERFTRERLTAQAQSEGRLEKGAPEVVFVSLTGVGGPRSGRPYSLAVWASGRAFTALARTHPPRSTRT